MGDVTFLIQYIDLVTLGICLCVGFAMKQAFSWFNNKYIPLAMLLLGTMISVSAHIGSLDSSVVLSGMISGLASTGFYEMLRNLLDKGSQLTKKL